MQQKLKRKLARYYFILRPVVAIILFLIIITSLFTLVKSINKISSLPSIIFNTIFSRGINLEKTDHRINILLLGVPGGNHDGADLTDTMILASLDVNKNDILLVSVPRDIWVESMKAKINTAYYYGEERKTGGGFILAKSAISETLGQPVDYVVKIDFDGFKKAVDLLDGIEVNVDKGFDDYEFPIAGKENDDCGGNDEEFKCRYEHISFKTGKQVMDGETALKYVRSRHANGNEGTDFARSRRQQQVILAVKNKALSLSTLFNPGKINRLLNVLGQSVSSDIEKEEIDDFVRLAEKLRKAEIRTLTLDQGDEENGKPGLLMNPDPEEYEGNWVLTPRSGDWQEIQEKIKKQLND